MIALCVISVIFTLLWNYIWGTVFASKKDWTARMLAILMIVIIGLIGWMSMGMLMERINPPTPTWLVCVLGYLFIELAAALFGYDSVKWKEMETEYRKKIHEEFRLWKG